MNLDELKKSIGGIDIYLLDQILKGRYQSKGSILDVGCGNGRNLKWFYQNDFTIYGIDTNTDVINGIKEKYNEYDDNFSIQNVDDLIFENNKFDHIICNALLHFAKDEQHFTKMFSELDRVLKPSGTIFIRMATIEGMEKYVIPIDNGVYHLPDGSDRFLLSKNLFECTLDKFNFRLLDSLKYVNVGNKRSMATFIIEKL